jgi:hypothetical protein
VHNLTLQPYTTTLHLYYSNTDAKQSLYVFATNTNNTDNKQWEARIGAALSRDGVTYVRVLKEHLVGTWLCVYAKQSLVPLITDARAGTVSSGMLGVMGNKVYYYTIYTKYC